MVFPFLDFDSIPTSGQLERPLIDPIRWTVSLRCLSNLPFRKGFEHGWYIAVEGRVATPAVVEDRDVLVAVSAVFRYVGHLR